MLKKKQKHVLRVIINVILVSLFLTGCQPTAQIENPETGLTEDVNESEKLNTENGTNINDSTNDNDSEKDTTVESETKTEVNPSESEPTEDNPVDSEPTEEPADTEIKDTTSEDKPTENTSEKDSSSEDNSKDEPVDTEVKDEPTEEPADSEKDSEKEPEPEKPEFTFTKFDSAKTMYASSHVNVRNLPSSKGEKIGELIQRQPVEVTGKCNETGWYEVVYEGKVAYVSSKYVSEKRVALEDVNEDEYWMDDEEIAAIKTPEPRYNSYIMGPMDYNVSKEEGWHYEGGYRYFKWVVDNAETSEGHWEAVYEFHKDNKISKEELIPWLDEGFGWDWPMPTRDGSYDGEEVRGNEYMWIYLGGGEVEK